VTKVIVKKTTIEDVEVLIERIRLADKREIECATGLPHYESIIKACETCDEVWSAFVDGDLIAVFGMNVISYVTGSAIPWFISTHEIEKHQIVFLKFCRPVFKKMCSNLNSLVNYVDDRNDLAKNWLKWLGFKLHDPVPFGVEMMPFRCFTMEVNHV
jgi:hypothetical protein